jgi:hypothetical protein
MIRTWGRSGSKSRAKGARKGSREREPSLLVFPCCLFLGVLGGAVDWIHPPSKESTDRPSGPDIIFMCVYMHVI